MIPNVSGTREAGDSADSSVLPTTHLPTADEETPLYFTLNMHLIAS